MPEKGKGKPAMTGVLLSIDVDFLAAYDAFVEQVGFGSRRQAIRHGLETQLAAHAASRQREREVSAEPSPWPAPAPAPRHTANTTAEAGGRPITADLGAL
jgi:hypothetical protein